MKDATTTDTIVLRERDYSASQKNKEETLQLHSPSS
jgi:hypothetical protein